MGEKHLAVPRGLLVYPRLGALQPGAYGSQYHPNTVTHVAKGAAAVPMPVLCLIFKVLDPFNTIFVLQEKNDGGGKNGK